MQKVMSALEGIQSKLDFEGAVTPHFVDTNGAGRHGIAGLGVGVVFGFCSCVILLGTCAGLPLPLLQWCSYMVLLSVFHAGEWYVTAAYRHKELEYKSWIINHSLPYTAVQIATAIEFWLEYLLLPSLKGHLWLISIAAILAIGSISIRIAGMAHCGENFDHIVMTSKKEGHQLITDGIYSYLRHPSYFGFYYWSVTAQILLGNPLMTVAVAIISRKFFADRIPPEEEVLVKIYGEQYKAFGARTPILIPFVEGHVPYVGRDAHTQKNA